MQIFSQNSILSKRLDKMKGVLKMYNVKISQYLESTEVVYYSNVITGREKEKDSFIVERDNELFEVYSFMAFGINKSEKSKEEKGPEKEDHAWTYPQYHQYSTGCGNHRRKLLVLRIPVQNRDGAGN